MLWRLPKHPAVRPHPEGFIIPAQPTLVTKPVTAAGWMHEVKHDGYRMIARRFPDGREALWSRNGNSWTDRLPLIKAALLSLPVESVTLDGEAIAPDPNGASNFTALRRRGGNVQALLMAFDIIELNGEDLRQFPLWHRREVLQGVALFGHEGAKPERAAGRARGCRVPRLRPCPSRCSRSSFTGRTIPHRPSAIARLMKNSAPSS